MLQGFRRIFSVVIMLSLTSCVTVPDNSNDLSAVIVQQYGGDANAYAYENLPYYDIISQERIDLLATLVKHGIDFNAFASTDYGVPVFFAVYFSKEKSLAYLLANGASISIAEQVCLRAECSPETLLLLAMDRDDPRVIQLLIENGAVVFTKQLANASKEVNYRAAISEALRKGYNGTLRGFELAGYAHFVAEIRDQPNNGQTLVAQTTPSQTSTGSTKSNEGPDLLSALAGVALGNMVGGDVGKGIIAQTVIGAMADSSNSSSNQPTTTAPVAPSNQVASNTSLAQLDIPSDLPPDIQRDMLVVQISDLLQKGVPAATLGLFQRLNDLPVPIDTHTDYFWGKSLIDAGRSSEGLKRLYRYVKRLDKNSAYYRPTLRLIAGAQS